MSIEMDAGYYSAAVVGAVVNKSQNDKLQMILTLKVLARGMAGKWERLPVEKERKVYVSLSPDARKWSSHKLGLIGFNGKFSNPMFATKNQTFECRHEEYPKNSGKKKERWEIYDPRQSKPADISELAELDALWFREHASKAEVVADGSLEIPAEEGAPDGEQPPVGDNIPF